MTVAVHRLRKNADDRNDLALTLLSTYLIENALPPDGGHGTGG
jgi:hypothetical protein